jgi:hypothetical protein
MGQPDLFAKKTFAEETERITGGAATWQDPPEIRLEKVQSDGFLVIRRPDLMAHLAAPWSEAQAHEEVIIELKLAGDHVDRKAVLLSVRPQVKERLIEKGIEKGRLAEACAALHRVLARRQFVLSPDDETRIDACIDLATLERWLEQAVTAASAFEALQ